MRVMGWVACAGALLAAGCSSIPFINSDGPHLTNAAVKACVDKADALGYRGVGERESTPEKAGAYEVVLDIRQNEGYGQIRCAYSPTKGADIAPPKTALK
jgi:hypothetical protein